MSELSQDPNEFMDSLTFGADAPAPPVLDAEHPVMVVRSLRWPLDLDERLAAAAKSRGVTRSQLIRDWIEIELAALENDQPISRADALRALASLRPVGLGGAA
jgi:predicted DNA-binding protein